MGDLMSNLGSLIWLITQSRVVLYLRFKKQFKVAGTPVHICVSLGSGSLYGFALLVPVKGNINVTFVIFESVSSCTMMCSLDVFSHQLCLVTHCKPLWVILFFLKKGKKAFSCHCYPVGSGYTVLSSK